MGGSLPESRGVCVCLCALGVVSEVAIKLAGVLLVLLVVKLVTSWCSLLAAVCNVVMPVLTGNVVLSTSVLRSCVHW
jgi:hypothetical protein